MDSAADCCGPAENPVDLGPVDGLRIGGGGRRQNNTASRKEFDNAHDDGPP
jgi:hypothetical protein